MAASGVLIARAAFVGDLPVLGVVSALGMTILSALTWRNGQAIYRERREPWRPEHRQAAAFGVLTAVTVLIAAIAIVVSVVI
jgi:type VI protein secretion system component VasK